MIARTELDPARPEIQGPGLAAAPFETAQPRAESDQGVMAVQEAQRRLDQARREALARDQRPAAGGAGCEAFPERRPEQPRRAGLGREKASVVLRPTRQMRTCLGVAEGMQPPLPRRGEEWFRYHYQNETDVLCV